jgi:hypothetical protein
VEQELGNALTPLDLFDLLGARDTSSGRTVKIESTCAADKPFFHALVASPTSS